MPYIWITIYFFSIQQTCAPFPGMKHNVPQCSLMADSLKWAGWVSLAAPAAQSCMGLRKHGLTHWDPRSTGFANELIDHWQVHKKLPPHLAYILWNCSGMDVNNLEATLVMTWHQQGAFQTQYGQATGLDARASRVKWPAQFMSHWYGILFTE